MRVITQKFLFSSILVVFSAFLLFLANPGYIELPFLAWIGLVPLFFALSWVSIKQAVFVGFVFGFFYYGSGMYWLINIEPVPFAWLFVTLFAGFVHFPLLAASCTFLNKRIPRLYSLNLVILWLSFDWLIRDQIFALPILNIADSQYRSLHLLQILDVGGVYLLTFTILLVNATFYIFISRLRKFKNIPLFPDRILTVITLFLLVGMFMYAYVILEKKYYEKDYTGTIKLLLIQPNFEKDNPRYDYMDMDYRINTFARFTRQALEKKTAIDIIVWPETSFNTEIFKEDVNQPVPSPYDYELYEKIQKLQREINLPVLFGSYIAPPNFNQETGYSYNSMIYIKDRELQWYRKIKPLIWGEYVPKSWGPARKIANKLDFAFRIPGDILTTFSHDNDNVRFATLMCSENGIPELVRTFVLKGAQFLINTSNNTAMKSNTEIHHSAILNRFRAIEHRLYVVEVGNVGETGLVSPDGQLVKLLGYFQDGYLEAEVPLKNPGSPTLYTKFGNIIIFLVISSLIFEGIFLRIRRL